jgi:hypothetical protein
MPKHALPNETIPFVVVVSSGCFLTSAFTIDRLLPTTKRMLWSSFQIQVHLPLLWISTRVSQESRENFDERMMQLLVNQEEQLVARERRADRFGGQSLLMLMCCSPNRWIGRNMMATK